MGAELFVAAVAETVFSSESDRAEGQGTSGHEIGGIVAVFCFRLGQDRIGRSISEIAMQPH